MDKSEAIKPEYRLLKAGRPGKPFINERLHPFIIEVPVAANGLDRALNREIVAFHKSQCVKPRFGRTTLRDGRNYYRWCFSDLDIARAFLEKFGGAFYKTTDA